MISSSRLHSNRLNAQKSTGPQSFDGRSRSSKNALKHGLTRGPSFDDDQLKKVDLLTRKLCEGRASQNYDLAHELAQAQIHLNFIRSLKQSCLHEHQRHKLETGHIKSKTVSKPFRQNTLSKDDQQHFVDKEDDDFDDFKGGSQHSRSYKFMNDLDARFDEFRKLGRYERVAVKRLKLAIRRYMSARE